MINFVKKLAASIPRPFKISNDFTARRKMFPNRTKRVFLLVLFLALSCSQLNYSRVKVLEVVDGDTIRLSNGKLLRYLGLDTPELRIKEKNGNFIYRPQPFSLEAKEFNRKLVEGKFIRIEFDTEKTDSYGRLLGYCFLEDTFINVCLVEEGYAVIYARSPNLRYSEVFAVAQKKARKAKKGLWGNLPVIDHNQARDYVNQIRSVEGVVLGSYRSKKCLFLNFGQNYKNDFTVAIFNDSIATFKHEGIDPESFYIRKKIRVTGKIREYNGPEIIANSPYEIEILDQEAE